MEQSGLSLRQRFLGGLFWTSASRGVITLFNMGVTVVLARLLLPSDYGLLAMAMVFVGLVQQGRDMGIGHALIQRERVDADTERQAFTYALLSALGLMALCLVSADLIGWLYGEPRVAPVIRVLALGFPLGSLQVVPIAMVRREMRLRGEALLRTGAILLDAAVTITLAWRGFGTWALVAGNLTGLVAMSAGLSVVRPWHLGLKLGGEQGRGLLRFGGGVTVSSFLWYTYSNLDFAIVGRLLGPAALGAYTMAWNLAKMPWDRLWIVVNPLVLPLFSRARGDRRQMASVLVRLTRSLAVIAFPMLLLLGLLADKAVPVVLGSKWEASVAPMRWLCLFGVARVAVILLPPVLLAAGRLRREIGFNALCVVVLPPAFLAGALWRGAEGVAMAWAVLYTLLAAGFLLPPALRATGLSIHRYLASLAPVLVASLVLGLSAWLIRWLTAGSDVVLLILASLGGLLAYLAVIRLWLGPWLKELRLLAQDARHGASG